MQSTLADFIRNTPEGQEAADILGKCVHCGFCNATCPTYQLLGDELDGPRGRIYLIKGALEGHPVTERTRLHLDRCLTCLACETICPSGVKYGRLLDIGRKVVAERVPRRLFDATARAALRGFLSRRWLFSPAARLGQLLRPLLPSVLADKLPAATSLPPGSPTGRHPRHMLMLAGCVQPGLAPNINAATARVLGRLGITLREAPRAGCCGALRQHLDDPDGALMDARRNIDAWWSDIEAGAEAVIVTASGCGVQVKEYGHLLRHDPRYAEKAARVSQLCRDPSEILALEAASLRPLLAERSAPRGRLAFHSPCSLQHGLKIRGVVERLLAEAGFDLTPVVESHLCCGSAGTYSLLQAELSQRLKERKLAGLTAGRPEHIATANIGCLTHLQADSPVPVRHWIEFIDEILR